MKTAANSMFWTVFLADKEPHIPLATSYVSYRKIGSSYVIFLMLRAKNVDNWFIEMKICGPFVLMTRGSICGRMDVTPLLLSANFSLVLCFVSFVITSLWFVFMFSLQQRRFRLVSLRVWPDVLHSIRLTVQWVYSTASLLNPASSLNNTVNFQLHDRRFRFCLGHSLRPLADFLHVSITGCENTRPSPADWLRC